MPYFQTKHFCHGAQLDMSHAEENWKMPCFQNEGHYRSGDLSRDKCLGVLSHGGKKIYQKIYIFLSFNVFIA